MDEIQQKVPVIQENHARNLKFGMMDIIDRSIKYIYIYI